MNNKNEIMNRLLKVVSVLVILCFITILLILVTANINLLPTRLSFGTATNTMANPTSATIAPLSENSMWQAPDTATLAGSTDEKLIKYGRELVAHTAKYLGPEGSVQQTSNGMNCQNCHLDAGTKAFGNNYSRVASSYPKFRKRSGSIEGFEKRINDCFERSLNGQPLDTASKEMKAMVAYLKWVGKDVKKGEKVNGAGLYELALLDRAASPEKGKVVYQQKCSSCHGSRGEGIKQAGASEYQYPPLSGTNSYNTGAGISRISYFARFVKANMPLGATYANPVLTDEEAWDVAAYVNSLPRPGKDTSHDWPDIADKPFDHPYGPYTDGFSENRHKYGPFKEIIEAREK